MERHPKIPDERVERLARYATWTAEDLVEFEARLMEHRRIDPDANEPTSFEHPVLGD